MTYDWWRMCNTMELGSNSSHTEFFLSNNHIQTTSITKDLGQRWRTYGTRAQSGTRDDFTWHAKPKKFTKK